MVDSEEYDFCEENRWFREVTANFHIKSCHIWFLNYVC